jgi:hypothetical protein
MEKSKKYWFYIEPYVYISLKEQEVLLLNTLDSSTEKSIDKEVIALISSIFEPKNCGVTLLNEQYLQSDKIIQFIKKTQEKYMGDIIEYQTIKQKPIQLLPYINIQNDIKPIKTNKNFVGDNLLNDLRELTLYINTKCKQSCQNCNSYYKQFRHCNKYENKNIELKIDLIKKILDSTKTSPLSQINIIGGDITRYNDLSLLIRMLKPYEEFLSYYIQYRNILNIQHKALISYKNKKQLFVCIDFPISELDINSCINVAGKGCTFSFIVKDIKEYIYAQSIIEKYSLDFYQIMPFFNNKNITFFKNNVFINESDIIEGITFEQIMLNKKINSNFWGNILVMPDGSVKSCINESVIGNIKEQSILELLNIEINKSSSMWLKTREEKPCCDCIYQHICPPLSNYEAIFNKTNLCNVIP